MKTLLIPLDERPCNRVFPSLIGDTNQDIELFIPPLNILGHKKKPADVRSVSEFLFNHIEHCDNLILSIDMILYGGLIPSRTHYLTYQQLQERLSIIQLLRQKNPNIKIYAFSCIMRAPSYNSSEEEPDYYAEYGYALFRRQYLLDYQNRYALSHEEKIELRDIYIPLDIINDYEQRRELNTIMNLEVVKYLEAGDIDFLIIPQDDSAPFGYTAISQKSILDEIQNKYLDMKMMIYPGADEVSMSLLSRAYHEYKNEEPRVYPFYASVLGPTILPNYEDRPMYESLKSHIRVCKARLVESPQEADYILAINSPGKIMQESFVDKQDLDISYTSYRNLLDFAYQIQTYIKAGYSVSLCDSAFSNGGDLQLIQYLDQLNVLDQLKSYAGWNTNCNSLGTTLAQMFIGQSQLINHLCYRIIEDVFYQSLVRKEIIDHDLIELGLSYYDFHNLQDLVEKRILDKLQTYYNSLKISLHYPCTITEITMPWERMFEIGMKIEVKDNERKDDL